MTNARTYPSRPFLAVSAAIFRDGKVLIVRRGAAAGARRLYAAGRRRRTRRNARTSGHARGAGGDRPRSRAGRSCRLSPGHRARRRPAASSGISSFCHSRRAGSRASSRSTRNCRRRIGCVPSELAGLTTTEGLAEIIAAAGARLAACADDASPCARPCCRTFGVGHILRATDARLWPFRAAFVP